MSPTFAFVTGPEIMIVVGLAVLLFGAERIPKLARSMGQAKKEFESAQRGAGQSEQPPAAPVPPIAAAPPPTTPAPPLNPPQP
ncbi:MAG: twin-arginine translocase TatA/TatE family subunit [Candidatus Eremiobacter antarcticus]|nr:twin-arginine translocase TatA/TatE family subunit [Candidatus Eremiobacteraeota bacterium]MBC5808005.1 twin-arginine translocase TatA/TatE family subunit [Candidatus Eremiobacteraeota bacterium]PZR62638.1 MAG: twin-arginine translocase TatA/TatE family subunit [Candidatus Eremiobacter sp. RRmetagenome_bin22]